MKICNVTKNNFNEWVLMGLELWPAHKRIDLEKELKINLKSRKSKTILIKNENGEYLGFINLTLRTDYVQGAKSTPVAYVEGIFIKPKYRKQGIAKILIKEAERWAKKKGCKELGSDAEIENISSQNFHTNLGFKKTGVNVHFIKKIK